MVKDLYLTAKDVHFSDNFFDILPGQVKKVTLSRPATDIKMNSINLLMIKN